MKSIGGIYEKGKDFSIDNGSGHDFHSRRMR